jgi:pimeloyl-ACP methyl ester carboxylesterase
MSRAGRLLGLAAATTAAVAGAAVAAERLAVRRLRDGADPDAGAELVAPFDELLGLASHDGGGINVVRRGAGQPIVLSHGVLLSVRTWVKQLEALPDAGYQVIAFDHRGHGGSKLGTDGHTIEALASDVRTVLEQLDLRDAVLVGHSMGGVAVQAFCLHHPEVARERVAGIVLLSTFSRAPLHGNPRLRHVLAALARQAPDGAVVFGPRDLGLLVARLGFGRRPQASHVELTRQMILACDPVTRRDAPAALLEFDFTGDLGRIEVPTLVVCGSADVITPPAESRRMARRIPGARLEIVAGAGHMLMLEQADVLQRLLADFAVEARAVRAAG